MPTGIEEFLDAQGEPFDLQLAACQSRVLGTRRCLQQALLDQPFEMIPDVIGMGGTAEVEAQLVVGELGSIRQVGAGDEQLLISHHRLDVTDSFLSFKR
jgi:hypothetical protein